MDYEKLADFVQSLILTLGAQKNVIDMLQADLRKANKRIEDLESAPTEWVKLP